MGAKPRPRFVVSDKDNDGTWYVQGSYPGPGGVRVVFTRDFFDARRFASRRTAQRFAANLRSMSGNPVEIHPG